MKKIFDKFKHSLGRIMFSTGPWFYLGLSLIFLSAYFVPKVLYPDAEEIDYSTYDLTISVADDLELSGGGEANHRVVVVEIDEASLAELSPEFGRWPWSRAVLAEFLEYASAFEPAAIGVDVLFTDRDNNDPEGDEYLDEVVGALENVYLSALRLPEKNDHLSAVTAGMLPHAGRSDAASDEPVAVLLPFLPQALNNLRFGFTNFAHLMDGDGVVRRYPVTLDIHGYQVPSLATQLVSHAVPLELDQEEILLNYLSGRDNTTFLSFADTRKRLLEEDSDLEGLLGGSIILLGLTAPGLSDVRPTPVNDETPGLRIVATAVENLANETWYRDFGDWLGFVFLLLLVGVALVFLIRDLTSRAVDVSFAAIDFLPLAISSGLLLVLHGFADVTFASKFALGFFVTARFCQVIYRGELREGRLFIEDPDFPVVDMIFGYYRFGDEKNHRRGLQRLLAVIGRASRRISISDEVFSDEVGLLAESGALGGVLYGLVNAGEGEGIADTVSNALGEYAQAWELAYEVKLESDVRNDWGSIRTQLRAHVPLLVEKIQGEVDDQ